MTGKPLSSQVPVLLGSNRDELAEFMLPTVTKVPIGFPAPPTNLTEAMFDAVFAPQLGPVFPQVRAVGRRLSDGLWGVFTASREVFR